jgi:hypothetical protein
VIYDIYHDECKEDGYWHGFLFVPRDSRDALLNLLKRARENTGYDGHFHYVTIGQNAHPDGKKYIAAEAWTSIGCNALQQQKLRKYPPDVLLGRKPTRKSSAEYYRLTTLIKCKFVLFRENDRHRNMYEGMKQIRRIETTFRMAIKGGVHSLFSEPEPIQIGNVCVEGEEQPLSIDHTLQRFAREKRSYVSFVDCPMLISQKSNHNDLKPEQDPSHSHLLQLCDILIGGFRFHACWGHRAHPRFQMSHHCRVLLDHEQENSARMAQSRYFKGFSLQQAWIENDEWNFAPLVTATRNVRYIQASLLLGTHAPSSDSLLERQKGE